MFLSQKQVNLFGVKKVAEREWHRQNRLREPFIKQWELRLKSYYKNLSKEIFDTWQTGSFFLISLDMNKNKTILQNIARVQYTIISEKSIHLVAIINVAKCTASSLVGNEDTLITILHSLFDLSSSINNFVSICFIM